MAEPAAVAAPLVDRAVAGDAEQPRHELAAVHVELLRFAPESQEHVLRHIFSHVAVPHDAQHDRIHQVAVAVVYGLERRKVAGAEALHQVFVTECAVFHALQLPAWAGLRLLASLCVTSQRRWGIGYCASA